ncbi:MAG TPA: adenylate/guanylate cyclase domain-containing protein [Candidatus Limnocylindria bacterium]|nr:adenylate/guanylate cyclase domain-containing protein [Candidatus Limnocylindria bacterium]
MLCASCGYGNPPGMRFCGQCGIELAPGCPRCGAEMPGSFVFCGRCGARLGAEPEERAGDTRQITVLFADISGFTALAERLGPEELHESMRTVWDLIAADIRANGGLIEKYIGDAVVAAFGAVGEATNDHPEQAQRAALAVLAALERANGRIVQRTQRRLALRVGVNTGIAVTGAIGDRESEFGVLGDAVNVAARLEQAAEPGEILVGDATYRRTPGLFAYEPHPPVVARGKTTPVVAWRLVGVAAEEAGPRLRTALVGRDDEMGTLLGALGDALSGRGRLVSIVGEPGLGKSRLIDELITDPRVRGARVGRVRSTPYDQHRSYGAIGDMLRRVIGIQRTASADHALHLITETQPDIEPGTRALILSALGYGVDLPAMSGETKRRLLGRGFAALLSRVASSQGLVIAIDDLQWIDPSSLASLVGFAAGLGSSRALAVVAYRPEFTAPWATTREHLQLRLRPLDETATETLVRTLVPTGGVDREIAARAQGNPAYAEEAIRLLAASGVIVEREGTSPLVDLSERPALPDSLQQLLLRRVDAVATPDRRVLHAASVAGRTFDAALLRSIWGAEVDVDGALERLAAAAIVEAEGGLQRFTQTGLREVVYGAMLARHREELHGRVGVAIESGRPEVAVQQPALLAMHFAASTHTMRAIDYAFRAAERASSLYDLESALHHYRLAASLALRLPDGTMERARALLAASDAAAGIGARVDALLAAEEALATGLAETDLRAALRRRAGRLAARAGMVERAAEHLADAERLTPSFGSERAELTLAKAALARADDRPSEALTIARIAVREAQSAGDGVRELEAEAAVVACATDCGLPEEAHRSLVRCAELATRLGDLSALSRTLAAQAVAALDRGDAHEAEPLALELLATSARVGDIGGQARALRALAKAQELLGREDESHRALQRALALADPNIPDAPAEADAARTLLALGRFALRQPDLGLAATTLEEARVVAPRSGDEVHLAALISAELARVAVARGAVEEARQHAQAATAAQRAHRCRRCAAEIGPALVEAALAGNDLAAADAARALSLEAAYRLNLPIAIAGMRLAGGRLLAARGDLAGAAVDYRAALDTFEKLGPRHMVAETRAAMVGTDAAARPESA